MEIEKQLNPETGEKIAAETQKSPRDIPKPSKENRAVSAKINALKTIWAVGRRKTAAARVRMVPSGNGSKILVNGLSVDDYFKGNKRQVLSAMMSLNAVKGFDGYHFFVKVEGGGITGQAEAIRHGIARALAQWDPKARLQMRKEGYLTRDPRTVERKKSGQPKARKRFQYSKR